MSQVIETLEVPRGAVRRRWILALRHHLHRWFGRSTLNNTELMSAHMLRDIGIGGDARANPLLGDAWLRR